MAEQTEKRIYLKGLDGIRAIAALGVFVFHMNENLHLPTTMLGPSGVTIFFALSGFLITFLMLKEIDKTNTVNIGSFYVRRCLRIWPLYFFYLLIVVIARQIFDWDLLYYVFFLGNFPFVFGEPLPHLGHYWSLAVEEQFYLFWPFLIKYSKNIIRNLILFLSVYFIIKLAINIGIGGTTEIYKLVYITKFDCMALGGIVACLYFKNHSVIKILSTWYMQLLAISIIVLVAINRFHIVSIVDPYFITLATLIFVVSQSKGSYRIINLDNLVMNFLGKISFGIYVYHGFIMHLIVPVLKKLQLSQSIEYVVIYISCFVLTILVSYLSYRFIESPFLKMKERFSLVKSGRPK